MTDEHPTTEAVLCSECGLYPRMVTRRLCRYCAAKYDERNATVTPQTARSAADRRHLERLRATGVDYQGRIVRMS